MDDRQYAIKNAHMKNIQVDLFDTKSQSFSNSLSPLARAGRRRFLDIRQARVWKVSVDANISTKNHVPQTPLLDGQEI